MGLWFRKRATNAVKGDETLPIIRLQGVSKTFKGESDDDTVALDDVTVDINRGEYVSVSGPSGCGKSTFLSILALLETPTKGLYWLNGRRTDQLTPAERARVRSLDVGLIFQSFNLIADMSVYENVEYPLTLRGKSAQERAQRVNAALDRVGMTSRGKVSCQGAINNSSPSPGPSPDSRRSCWRTSPQAIWTRRPATR
jgi:putative ABC transport system ATP-binding protein